MTHVADAFEHKDGQLQPRGQALGDPSLPPSHKINPDNTLILDFWPPELTKENVIVGFLSVRIFPGSCLGKLSPALAEP